MKTLINAVNIVFFVLLLIYFIVEGGVNIYWIILFLLATLVGIVVNFKENSVFDASNQTNRREN